MKLFLQKNAKFSSAGGSAPRPHKQPPHCEYLATRLALTTGLYHLSGIFISSTPGPQTPRHGSQEQRN